MEWKSNERGLNEIREKRSLITSIMERKIKWIGHLIGHSDFLNNIFEGRIIRQRPRVNYFHDINEKMGCISYQLKEVAKDRHTRLFRHSVAFRSWWLHDQHSF